MGGTCHPRKARSWPGLCHVRAWGAAGTRRAIGARQGGVARGLGAGARQPGRAAHVQQERGPGRPARRLGRLPARGHRLPLARQAALQRGRGRRDGRVRRAGEPWLPAGAPPGLEGRGPRPNVAAWAASCSYRPPHMSRFCDRAPGRAGATARHPLWRTGQRSVETAHRGQVARSVARGWWRCISWRLQIGHAQK